MCEETGRGVGLASGVSLSFVSFIKLLHVRTVSCCTLPLLVQFSLIAENHSQDSLELIILRRTSDSFGKSRAVAAADHPSKWGLQYVNIHCWQLSQLH